MGKPHCAAQRINGEEAGFEGQIESIRDVNLGHDAVVEDGRGPLEAFLVGHSRPDEPALLPSLVMDDMPRSAKKAMVDKGAEKGKRSDRLAAKPTAGWSAMEKVKLVLLEKSGIIEEGGTQRRRTWRSKARSTTRRCRATSWRR